MNKHIRALAWWHLVFNGLCLVAGVVICLLLFSPEDRPALLFIGTFFLALAAVYFLPGFLGGWGLFHYRGWARVLVIIESVLYLPLVPLGTVLGGYGLWVLLKPESALLFGRGESSPLISHPWIPDSLRSQHNAATRRSGVLFAGAVVGSGFIVMIGTGYRLSGDAGSPISPTLYYGAIAVLAGAIVIVVREIQAGRWPVRSRRVVEGSAQGLELHYSRQPIDEAPSPVASAHDQAGLGTCPHLQPIEQAMLNEGILIGVITQRQVRAYCIIDQPVLRQRFQLSGPLDYFEQVADDPPAAIIGCDTCHSVIEVVHGDAAVPETPVFPGAKAGHRV